MFDHRKHIRAAVLTRLGKPLEVLDLKIPELARGQVLVDVLYSGICRSQLMEARGHRGADPWLPHMLGHEGTGIVREVGSGVTRVQPGDRVVLGWIKAGGLDVKGAKYETISQKLTVNSGAVTTLSTATIVSESRLVHLPVGMPEDLGVLLGCALPTGAGMVLNEVMPSVDDTLAIVGLGGIGLSALVTALALGVKAVVAIDVVQERLDLAKKLGAELVVNASKVDAKEVVFQRFVAGVDACIEAGGSVSTIELGFSLINRTAGRLVFASHPKHGEKISIDPHELISGKKISGSWGGQSDPEQISRRLGDLFREGSLALDCFVGRHYSLDDVNHALDDLEKGLTLRPIIHMG